MKTTTFTTLIERYKRKLTDVGLGDENYKWVWIQRYQGKPNLDADDFVREMQLATRTNLMYQLSSAVLVRLAKLRPVELKQVLAALYDESGDLKTRIDSYMDNAEALFGSIRTGDKRSSHQDERTISVLLALQYPERYPIYKDGLYKKLCKDIGIQFQLPGRKYVDYIGLVRQFVDDHIRQDTELISLVKSQLPSAAYEDPNFLILAQDILHQNYEGEASNRETAVDPTKPRVWLLSPGTNASIWPSFKNDGVARLNQEFGMDLTMFSSQNDLRKQIVDFEKKRQKNRILALWEFAHVMKPGDFIIVKKGLKTYIGVGKVLSGYRFDGFRKDYPHVRDVEWFKEGSWQEDSQQIVTKTLTDITKYPDYVRKLKEQIGFGDKDPVDLTVKPHSPYSLAHATSDSFLDPAWLKDTLELWAMKQNLVLQGPPGTGKTFVAKRLAWLLMGEKDESRLHMVQFHPSYSYEDFIEGYRPDGNGGFKLATGHFLAFCKRAASDPDRKYVFVIDEINRGNLSKVFGEVMMGIEADKRGETLRLQYSSDRPFTIPPNVHLIGTMNTADRSLSLVDYALRRRFAFKTVEPEFGDRFVAFMKSKKVSPELITRITTTMARVNHAIEHDPSLGKGYFVGHSYFCSPPAEAHEAWLNRIWEYEVLPLMEEYWFDQSEKATEMKKVLGVA